MVVDFDCVSLKENHVIFRISLEGKNVNLFIQFKQKRHYRKEHLHYICTGERRTLLKAI